MFLIITYFAVVLLCSSTAFLVKRKVYSACTPISIIQQYSLNSGARQIKWKVMLYILTLK